MKEPEVVDAIKNFISSKPDVSGISTEKIFIKNGCTSDVVGYSNGKIKYIIECKGSVSPGGIAGGLGQAVQYYFQKNYDSSVSKDAEVFFACPQNMTSYLDVMIIPKEIKNIFLVKENKEVVLYKKSNKKNIENILQIEGTTYLEATTIELITLSLQVLFSLNENERNKKNFEKKMKELYPKITDHRNTLITPRNLGLVSTDYNLTPKGYFFYGLLKRNKSEFRKELIKLLNPYLIVLLNGLIQHIKNTNQPINKFKSTNKEIEKAIIDFYGSEVNFFDDRRISYGMGLLKEIGAIEEFSEDNKKFLKLNKIIDF